MRAAVSHGCSSYAARQETWQMASGKLPSMHAAPSHSTLIRTAMNALAPNSKVLLQGQGVTPPSTCTHTLPGACPA